MVLVHMIEAAIAVALRTWQVICTPPVALGSRSQAEVLFSIRKSVYMPYDDLASKVTVKQSMSSFHVGLEVLYVGIRLNVGHCLEFFGLRFSEDS